MAERLLARLAPRRRGATSASHAGWMRGPRRRGLLAIALLAAMGIPAVPAHHDAAGTFTHVAELPLPTSLMAGAWDGERYVYLFGGFASIGGDDASAGKRSEQIIRYDTWSDQVSYAPAVLPSGRTGASAVWDPRSLDAYQCSRGCAYVFGGERGHAYLDEILRYDPVTNLVTRLEARLPTARFGTVAVWTGEHAYVFGGGSLEPASWRDVLRFDPSTQTLTRMKAQLPETMHYATGVWDPRDRPEDGCAGGCAYLFGGSRNVSGNAEYRLDLVVRYHPATDTIRTMGARLPSPRLAAAAVWDGTHAFILGGDSQTRMLGDVARYDPAADRMIALPLRLEPARCCMTGVWAGPHGLLLGGSVPGESDDVLRFHPPSPNLPPSAALVTEVAQLHVGADASASRDPDGGPLSFAWDWGDGATDAGGPTASHAYAQAGTYTIRLTVTDESGSAASATRTVTVAAPPPPAPPPHHAPAASFTVATHHLAVAVDGSASRDADGTLVAYAWDWGDGATGAGATATHTYATAGTYTLRLTVTDDQGATDSATRSVTVTAPPPPPNQAPVAVFSTRSNGLDVATDATASYDPDGTIAAYAWSWGDGTSGAGATAARTYAGAGTYTIRLTVTDAQGAAATAVRTVTVAPPPPPPNHPPVAAFSAALSHLTVTVDGRGSRDADGAVTTYAWAWGDGATGTGATATHTYAAPGDYLVHLTVGDDQGATASTTRTVAAVAPPAAPPPDAAAAPPPPQETAPPPPPVPVLRLEPERLTVTADATGSHAHGGYVVSYEYRWGDGNVTATAAPRATHTYAATGTYAIRLVVGDHHGNTNETIATITVPPPVDEPAEGARGDAVAPDSELPPGEASPAPEAGASSAREARPVAPESRPPVLSARRAGGETIAPDPAQLGLGAQTVAGPSPLVALLALLAIAWGLRRAPRR